LVPSVTEAVRKIKAGAVEINGSTQRELLLTGAKGLLVVRAGKKWKRVQLKSSHE
jgi:hypothetical protein